jgi:hypothetical protein
VPEAKSLFKSNTWTRAISETLTNQALNGLKLENMRGFVASQRQGTYLFSESRYESTV